MSAATRVSVIILNHNGLPIVGLVEKSLARLRGDPLYGETVELVVVDDHSTDGSDAALEALCARYGATLTRTEGERRGVSAGRNAGLACAHGEYVAFLDNDAIPEEGWLPALVAHLDAHPRSGACASLVVYMDKPDVLNSAGSVLNELFHGTNVGLHEMVEFARLPAEVMYPTGNGMALRRAALEEVGPFDEGYLYWGADDADYGLRLRRAGWACTLAPEARVRHLHSYSKGESGMAFWDGRNRLRMALKHLAWWELLRFLPWDAVRNGRIARQYLRGWASVLAHPAGRADLWRYRRATRGQPGHWAAFRAFFATPERLCVVPDNRPYGLEAHDLEALRAGEQDERYLYHGWYWPDAWAGEPFRWALPNASLVARLPQGARGLRLRLLAPPGQDSQDPAALRVLVRPTRPGAPGDARPTASARVVLTSGGPQDCEVPCDLAPGEYRIIFLAEREHLERGCFPRRIGFGLLGLQVLPGAAGGAP